MWDVFSWAAFPFLQPDLRPCSAQVATINLVCNVDGECVSEVAGFHLLFHLILFSSLTRV